VVHGGTGRDQAKADPDELVRSAASTAEGMATVFD
jgi:hypothetical protein